MVLVGPIDRASVRNYQTAAGVVVDGIIGAQTWDSLMTRINDILDVADNMALELAQAKNSLITSETQITNLKSALTSRDAFGVEKNDEIAMLLQEIMDLEAEALEAAEEHLLDECMQDLEVVEPMSLPLQVGILLGILAGALTAVAFIMGVV